MTSNQMYLHSYTPKLRYNERSRKAPFVHYIVTFIIVKGAGICSLYQEIHYIEIRYIEVWVYVSQKLPGITFWLFLLCFGQILKKTPVPDNFQLTIYKLKLPGTSYILKVQPLPGNSMLTYSKLGIARNLLHFLEIVRNHFHF